MVDAVTMEWVELYQLLEKRYPDLPLHESYVECLRDAYVKFPTEVLQIVKPTVLDLAEHVPDVIEAYGTYKSNRTLALFGRLSSIFSRAAQKKFSKSADNSMNGINDLNGICIIDHSILDRSDYYSRWMQGIGVANAGSMGLGITTVTALGITSAPLAAVVIVPIWWGGLFTSASTIALPASQAVYNSLREGKPRILGSRNFLERRA
jgi:hypothetical protein